MVRPGLKDHGKNGLRGGPGTPGGTKCSAEAGSSALILFSRTYVRIVRGCVRVRRRPPAGVGARFTARTAWFDAEQRLAASAASGVDAEVVSPFPPLLNYALPAGFGRDLARWVSEYIASLCSALPGRFYGLGTVPLQDPDLAAGELSSVAGLGLAGVEIASNVAGVSLADPRFLGHHRRCGGEVSVAAAGVQPRGGRVPAHADAGAVVLGPNLERGTARRTRARGFAVGGGPGRADRAGPPVLVRLAGVRPARDQVPHRHAGRGPAAGGVRLPGDAAGGPGRAHAADDGAGHFRTRGRHVAQLLPVPRNRSTEVILI